MSERHTVYITREIEIEVEGEVRRGTADTWWEQGDPDRGWVLHASEQLTEAEESEAVGKAMDKPTPEPDPWPDDDPIDNSNRPF